MLHVVLPPSRIKRAFSMHAVSVTCFLCPFYTLCCCMLILLRRAPAQKYARDHGALFVLLHRKQAAPAPVLRHVGANSTPVQIW